MSLWDVGGTGCVASKTDRLSPSEDRSLEMDIMKRREHLDQPTSLPKTANSKPKSTGRE